MLDFKIRRGVAAMALICAACASVAAPADDMRKAVEFDDANTVQKLLARAWIRIWSITGAIRCWWWRCARNRPRRQRR
jgi:hypothetical protein